MLWQGCFPTLIAYDRCRELTDQVLAVIPANHLDRVRLAYIEAISNAVKASVRHGGEQIDLCWTLNGTDLTLEIINRGIEFEPTIDQWFLPELESERGRGLYLMRHNSDTCRFQKRRDATHLTMAWRLDQYRFSEVA